MYPFHIETKDSTSRLYQLKDGRYQIIENGELGPFMAGYGYLLLERELAEFLECLPVETATFRDAIIFDPSNSRELETHVEVIVDQRFEADQMNDINLDGDRILLMSNRYVFISPSLKKKLENSEFNYLKFSEGLSNFA